ncbi:SURF1 family protein [Azohydromonas lata]|uniref:SURF1-like protein n=1 Tax=Azohydromonas lata TaxID=45677 RepID=A0ABU5IN13_9BURK|nr:SURF1 family protein [Azohydromonas lata]MDZ5460282.1 SURF1 family protein [Azohydromonas lata]
MTREDASLPRGPRSRGALVALMAGAALLLAGFLALGTWQVQRLAWKRELIARVEQRLQAAPVPAPGPSDWPTLNREDYEYRRVGVRGTYAHELETLVRASTELGTGYWVLTPLRTERGYWLLVNRGFIPPEMRAREVRGPEPQGEQTVAGLLRLSEPEGSLLQKNAPAEARWYSRDVAAIAAARDLGGVGRTGAVAPYFVDASTAPGAPADAWPRAGLTVVKFSNNHLSYAITWYALAAMVAAAALYLLRCERRLRDAHAPAASALHRGGD